MGQCARTWPAPLRCALRCCSCGTPRGVCQRQQKRTLTHAGPLKRISWTGLVNRGWYNRIGRAPITRRRARACRSRRQTFIRTIIRRRQQPGPESSQTTTHTGTSPRLIPTQGYRPYPRHWQALGELVGALPNCKEESSPVTSASFLLHRPIANFRHVIAVHVAKGKRTTLFEAPKESLYERASDRRGRNQR